MLELTDVLNPGAVTVTLYVPGRSVAVVKSPVLVEVSTVCSPDPVFRTSTLALAMAAPLLSRTFPVMMPPSSCA